MTAGEVEPGRGHFDVYVGETFERVAAAETDFLVRSLAVRRPAEAS